jgi:hypothetical protein
MGMGVRLTPHNRKGKRNVWLPKSESELSPGLRERRWFCTREQMRIKARGKWEDPDPDRTRTLVIVM